MDQEEIRGQLLSRQSLLGYLYAWKEMSSLETVKDWVQEVSSTDHGLIDLLMSLRTNVFSSDKGAYRRIDHDQVKDFFDDWDGVRHIKGHMRVKFFFIKRNTGIRQLVQELAFPVLQLRIRSYRERNAFSPPSICLHIRAFIGAS